VYKSLRADNALFIGSDFDGVFCSFCKIFIFSLMLDVLLFIIEEISLISFENESATYISYQSIVIFCV
jgi:hypothetical protein